MPKPLYDKETVSFLNKQHPELAMNIRTDLPAIGPNNTILYNGLRRTSHQFWYKENLLSFPQYLNARLQEVRTETDPSKRAVLYNAFQREAHDLTLTMPSISAESNRITRFGIANSAVDIARKKTWSSSMAPVEEYETFVKEMIGRGGGTSSIGSKASEFRYNTRSIMGAYAWLGPQEYVRHFSTLMNFVPIGNESGPGFGVTHIASTTKTIQDINQGIVDEVISGAIPSSAGIETKVRAEGMASENAIVRMAQYSSNEALAGGAYAIRDKTFDGLYSYTPKTLSFSRKDLPTEWNIDRFIPGSELDPNEIQTLRAISFAKDEEYIALTEEGMSRDEALEFLKKKRPKDVNVVSSVVKEGENLRLFYHQREFIGPGTKLSADLRKGLAAAMPSAFEGVDPSVQVLMPPLTSAETSRQLLPIYQAAEIYLTDKQFVSEEQRVLNVKRIADAINEENLATHVMHNVTTQNGNLLPSEELTMTQGYINRVKELLPQEQKNVIDAMIRGENVPHPKYFHVLPQLELAKEGSIASAGVQDIMGFMMTGQTAHADMLSRKIAGEPVGKEMRDVFTYLHNQTPISGAETINEGTRKLIASTKIKRGALEGVSGNAIFDPNLNDALRGKVHMMDLGHEVSLSLSESRKQTFSSLPIISIDARKMKAMPSGTVWAGEINRKIQGLAQAIEVGHKEGVELAAQDYLNALGGMSGKGKQIAGDTLKTRLSGIRGTMGFLNPDAENIIRRNMNLTHGESGFVAVSIEQARTLFGMAYGSTGPRSDREIKEAINWGGVFFDALRYPAAPRGWAPVRLALRDAEVRRAANFGADALLISPGAGTYIHGDLDQDTLNLIASFMKDPGAHAESRKGWEQNQGVYETARQEAVKKLQRTGTPFELASQAGLEALDKEQVAMANIYKNINTGIAHNAGFRVYEGAIRRGKDANLVGQGRFTESYAGKLSNILFALGEESINTKRNQGKMNVDLMAALYHGTSGERKARLMPLIQKHVEAFGVKSPVGQVAQDILDSLATGSATVMGNIQRMNRPGASVQDVIDAILPQEPTIVKEGLTGKMANAGILRATEGMKQQNEEFATAAKETASSGLGLVKEAVGDYTRGLKEGRGWTSLAIGGAILAGVGLSMRKPGNIIVVNNSQQRGEQRSANGTYTQTNESSVTAPRREHSVRLMHEKQYDVRVKIKEAQRQDSKKFVDLANAISGKYQQPARANINIRDDSDEQDYNHIFRKEFERQLRNGG